MPAQGAPTPDTCALEVDGRPATDPNSGLAGSIAPSGGHKGTAIALIVEVLAAGLNGSNWWYNANALGNDLGSPSNLGQNLIAIRPDALGNPGHFDRIEKMLAAMTQQSGTRVPSDRRYALRGKIRLEGVEVGTELLDQLHKLGALI